MLNPEEKNVSSTHKNYTKNALRVADNAMIEGACIHREARR
jgi:hypothetical protein